MLADERLGRLPRDRRLRVRRAGAARCSRASSFVPRLDAGHTVALDDPIAAARFAAEEVEFWRDQGIYYFVPCVFEGAAIAVLALGRKDSDEPFNSEDLGAADRGRRPGGDGDRERPPVPAAAPQGRRARPDARVQREHPRVARRRAGGVRRGRADRPLEPRARDASTASTRADAIGRTLGDVFDAPFVEALRAARRENPRGATLFKVPLIGRRTSAGDGRAGRGCWSTRPRCRCRTSPAPTPSSGTILLIEDITDRVRLEEQLQISEKMASIGLLAAGVAHEVNTPLTGISSFTQMLLEGADPADPKTALLEKIERQTFRAAKIVNGLLNLSRPGTPGGERTERRPERRHHRRVLAARASVRGRQHQGAPRAVADRRSRSSGIEHQLQQVFLNLFLNARDAMPRGGWLTVSTRVDGDQRGRRDRRHRVGHSARAARAHLRSVLHDQGDRPRHRPRPVDHLRHRARARRHDPLRQRGRPGHALHARRCRGCRRVAPGAPSARASGSAGPEDYGHITKRHDPRRRRRGDHARDPRDAADPRGLRRAARVVRRPKGSSWRGRCRSTRPSSTS